MSNGINLLGKKKQVIVTPAMRNLARLRLIAMWSLFGVAGFSIIVFLLVSLSPLPGLLQQEKIARITLSSHHQDIDKLMFVQDRLKTSSQIIAKRPNLDERLFAIQERMPEQLSITEVSVDAESVSLTVNSPSLSLLDAFTNSLLTAVEEKKDFSEVVMTKLFTNEQDNTFLMSIKITLL